MFAHVPPGHRRTAAAGVGGALAALAATWIASAAGSCGHVAEVCDEAAIEVRRDDDGAWTARLECSPADPEPGRVRSRRAPRVTMTGPGQHFDLSHDPPPAPPDAFTAPSEADP